MHGTQKIHSLCRVFAFDALEPTKLGSGSVFQGMTGAISKCQQLVEKTPDAFCLQQFENPANPEVHYKTTGPEIWRDTAGRVDYLVAGIASLLP